MNLLEKTAEHKMQIDKEILDLERHEQKNRVSNMRWFYSLQGLGAITAAIFILGSLGIFAYLVINDKPNAWLSLIPAIITSIVKFLSRMYCLPVCDFQYLILATFQPSLSPLQFNT